MTIYFIMLVDIIFIAADAHCDRGVRRVMDWWEWHISKWLHFYGPQVLLILVCLKCGWIPIKVGSLLIGLAYVVMAYIIWNLVYGDGNVEKDTEMDHYWYDLDYPGFYDCR